MAIAGHKVVRMLDSLLTLKTIGDHFNKGDFPNREFCAEIALFLALLARFRPGGVYQNLFSGNRDRNLQSAEASDVFQHAILSNANVSWAQYILI